MTVSKAISRNLLAIARAYAKATGVPLASVSRHIYGRAGFFEDLRRGRQSMTLKNLDTVLERFRKCWPKGAAWPATDPITMPGKQIPVENS